VTVAFQCSGLVNPTAVTDGSGAYTINGSGMVTTGSASFGLGDTRRGGW
jgi:hypothetical protein